MFLANCPPTPPLSIDIDTYFSLRAKCWLRGGVGGLFPRNVLLSEFTTVGHWTMSSKILIVIRHDVWTDQILMTHYKVERFNSI